MDRGCRGSDGFSLVVFRGPQFSRTRIDTVFKLPLLNGNLIEPASIRRIRDIRVLFERFHCLDFPDSFAASHTNSGSTGWAGLERSAGVKPR